MTIEEAIERVEIELDLLDRLWGSEQKEPLSVHCFMEALRLVLARAKEPRVYALGEEERKVLERVIKGELSGKDSMLKAAEHTRPVDPEGADELVEQSAYYAENATVLTAALNLQQPQGEPNV